MRDLRRTPAPAGLEPDPPPDEFAEALNAYWRRFGADACAHPMLPPACRATATRVLRTAVERDRPVGGWTVARCCGVRRPPEGVLL